MDKICYLLRVRKRKGGKMSKSATSGSSFEQIILENDHDYASPPDGFASCSKILNTEISKNAYENFTKQSDQTNSKDDDTLVTETNKLLLELKKQMADLRHNQGSSAAEWVDNNKNMREIEQNSDINISPLPEVNNITKIRGSDVTALRALIDIIPIFNGRNISIQTFARECRITIESIDEGFYSLFLRLLRSKIVGEADIYIKNRHFNSLDELLSILDKAFGTPKTLFQVESEIAHVKQNKGEDILSYGARVTELFYKMTEIIEQQSSPELATEKIKEYNLDVATCFRLGLQGELEARVRQKNPTSLQDAINAAIDAERDLNRRKRLYGNLSEPSTSIAENVVFSGVDSASREPHNKYHKSNHRSINHIREEHSSQSSDKDTICYSCGKGGHTSRSCGNKPNDKISNFVCYTCGEDGHISRNCVHRNINSLPNARKFSKSKNFMGKIRNTLECSYCNKKGHNLEKCFKHKIDEAERRVKKAEGTLEQMKRAASVSSVSSVSGHLNSGLVRRQGATMSNNNATERQLNELHLQSGKGGSHRIQQ